MLSGWIFESLHVMSGRQALNSFLEFHSILVGHDKGTYFACRPLLLLVLLQKGVLPQRPRTILVAQRKRIGINQGV